MLVPGERAGGTNSHPLEGTVMVTDRTVGMAADTVCTWPSLSPLVVVSRSSAAPAFLREWARAPYLAEGADSISQRAASFNL